MVNAELSTSQPEGLDGAQGTGHSFCDNTTNSNRRKQFREQNDSGKETFVPMCSNRSGASDIKAIVARRDRDRDQGQGQNGSQDDDRQTSAETKETPDKQPANRVKTRADDRSGPVQLASSAVTDPNGDLPVQLASSAVTDPNGDIADRLEEVKAQIADLLDRIESMQPGFAEKAMPKIETKQAADGPLAKKPQACDNQALLNSLCALAELLEELVDVLTTNAQNDDSNNGPPATEPVTPDYGSDPCEPEMPSSVDMFMSIYDQLSDDTRLEIVEILAAMAFEQNETDQGEVTPENNTPDNNTPNGNTPNGYDPYNIQPSTYFNDPTGDSNSNAKFSVDDLLADPEILPRAGIHGVEVTGMDQLFTDPDGMLSEESKVVVNKLIGNLSDQLGRIEVVANVYVDDDKNIGVHLTSGDKDGTIFYPKEGTIYSPHVHTNGSWIPSTLDLENEIVGAEDTIVVGDGVPGNEDGSYFQYSNS
jgi:hypothetical protein